MCVCACLEEGRLGGERLELATYHAMKNACCSLLGEGLPRTLIGREFSGASGHLNLNESASKNIEAENFIYENNTLLITLSSIKNLVQKSLINKSIYYIKCGTKVV